jgi:hypothetical protein
VAVSGLLVILALVFCVAHVSIERSGHYVLWGRESSSTAATPAVSWGLPGVEPWRAKLVLSQPTAADFEIPTTT